MDGALRKVQAVDGLGTAQPCVLCANTGQMATEMTNIGASEDDRSVELSVRRQRRQKIASVVTKMYADASDVYDRSIGEETRGVGGCLVGLGRRVRRGLGCMPSRQRLVDEDLLVQPAASSAKTSTLTSAFFGQRKSASTPALRLQVAQQSISERTVSLEQRAKDMREQAQAQVKTGAKQAALRSLRRSKQLEAQAQNLAKASMAVERQADMLEEAGLQQEVAKALQAGVKDIKKVQTAMKTVESISDDAATMADDVDEINQLLSQLADTGADAASIDDDDLLAELNDMEQNPPAEAVQTLQTEPQVVSKSAIAEPIAEPVATPVPTTAPFPTAPKDEPMVTVSLS